MSVDERIRRAIESATPENENARGDWQRVLRDAHRPRRGGLAVRAGAVAATALAVALFALASPFEGGQRATFSERALAAVGDGPVLHLVLRGDWGGAVLDLESAKVTPAYGETEVWYDPKRGLHEISRLGGTSMGGAFYRPERIPPALLEQYGGLADRYREALRSGRVETVGEGKVDGRSVRWIRVHSEYLPDVADGLDHLFAHEVAVDSATYEPVYVRTTRDGRAGPEGTGQTIVRMELLDDGSGDFSADPAAAPGPIQISPGDGGGRISLARARESFGGRALWLGTRFEDKPLAEFREVEHTVRTSGSDKLVRTLVVAYGASAPYIGGIGAAQPGSVVLEVTDHPTGAWRGAPFAGGLDEGTAMIQFTSAVVRVDDLYVVVRAATGTETVAAIAALRPLSGGPPVAPALARAGVDELARQVTAARPAPKVAGGTPVPPRAVRPKGPPLQSGSAHGVSVRVFAPNMAVFDTKRIDPSIRRLLRGQIGYSCFRAAPRTARRRGVAGASGALRLRYVVRMRGVEAPFDGCQISGTFGRRWGSGRSWHAPVELALTPAGRRHFAERAAARELAYFVRSPAMSAVRRALKREAGDPPAADALASRFPGAVAAVATSDAPPPVGKIGVWTDPDRILVRKAVDGRVLFVELREGRIARTNISGLTKVF
jgi:hypothetical protein